MRNWLARNRKDIAVCAAVAAGAVAVWALLIGRLYFDWQPHPIGG